MIVDSGQRTEFTTGAVRDMHENKGDMASIPWEAILRLSRHYENGAKKYNLGDEYSHIDSELVKNRTDYEAMSIEELQVAILEKMAQDGPVTDDMKRTVMENRHSGSLNNWVKSFR